MSDYGYNVKNIKSLDEIVFNGSFWYEYKNNNFLFKCKNKNTNLVVLFHGWVETNMCNVFRGYNYSIPNTDIVCLSNILTNIYPDLCISWYLSSKKYEIRVLYHDLFRFLLDNKIYKNVIFSGSSGGSYPSIYYASIFNKTAIVANPQIYLNEDDRYIRVQNLLKKNDDMLMYKYNELEEIITTNCPQRIILYQNTLDFDQYSKFVNFMNNLYPDIFEERGAA